MPVSKSMATRAMLLAALGGRNPREVSLTTPLCDDLAIIMQAATAIYKKQTRVDLDIHDSGTAKRFLTAIFAAIPGMEVTLHMSDRLAGRPIGALLDALAQFGATDIRQEGNTLYIKGTRIQTPKKPVKIPADTSSQVISALMLANILGTAPVTIHALKPIASGSYIKMTAEMMIQAGVPTKGYRSKAYKAFKAENTVPTAIPATEADWSAAAAFYEYSALSMQSVLLTGHYPKPSLQGDDSCDFLFTWIDVVTMYDEDNEGFVIQPFESDGQLIGITIPGEDQQEISELLASLREMDDVLESLHLSENPDLVPYIVVACALKGLKFKIHEVGQLRFKESDRLEALRAEMAKFGIHLTLTGDTISWGGGEEPHAPTEPLSSHGDHRIAMALAMAAPRFPGEALLLDEGDCVAKSFPGFWNILPRLGINIEEVPSNNPFKA